MSGSTSKKKDGGNNGYIEINVPSQQKRRHGHIYRLLHGPVVEKREWAVATFEVLALGRVVSYCCIRYDYRDSIGYEEVSFDYFDTAELALEFSVASTIGSGDDDD